MGGSATKIIGSIVDPIGFFSSVHGGGLMGAINKKSDKALPAPKVDGTAQADLEAAEKAAAAKAELSQAKRQKAIARSRSIFTTPLGLQEQAATSQKKLLGQ